MKTYRIWDALGDYGWLVGVVCLLAAGAFFYLGGPDAAGLPEPSQDEIVIAPKSGVEGFEVEPFCNDPLTKVEPLPAPDSSGITYQLTRTRDRVTETVV